MSENATVEVLGPTYEPGKPNPEGEGDWEKKLTTQEAMLGYIRTADRYWYAEESYGSEKRKDPA
ncbi:MAG: hypothetical protein AUJ92_05980 [Armatimonadetes bacterium CG2_30_59_28]|nr:hypothetical protein [Armatimonadota bacterium]OIO96423.1 MAG: hypothetical protein AUJ92_05980 [Armatimonadetes bacterium CG2_30_59_28]PIU66241.1 MAG: hypothetical protein COS85_05530 [Armatimonadetes bacterium CG07_land_8_20_14_0_80_59_28]PIX45071.1 MAG: hypothetical protein COZ56_02715 [Armatimonadetes bacterium CG_4_8_14_3_um_filter_58_9]PJB73348.1 MAG: hypothetical protein CO095_05895 [Armatimonadetes bacterium CG_4_9_14_3_um_filter_58_7]